MGRQPNLVKDHIRTITILDPLGCSTSGLWGATLWGPLYYGTDDSKQNDAARFREDTAVVQHRPQRIGALGGL
jgi:hypothetical protein